MKVTNLADLETTELRSGASDEVAWVGGFFAYGGSDAEQSDGAKPIKPGDVFVLTEGTSHDLRNTGSENLRIIAFFSKPEVEQHWDVDTWPPDGSKVTGSPNRG